MDDGGGMNKRKRKRDDDAGPSSRAAWMALVSEDDDDSSSAEAEVLISSSTEATMIGEEVVQPPMEEEEEEDPSSGSSGTEHGGLAVVQARGEKLKTLDLISTIGKAVGGSAGAGAQGMCSNSTAFAGVDVLSPRPIVQVAARAAPNIPVALWGARCPHCGVGTATMRNGGTATMRNNGPGQHVCLCHACRTDAVCMVCGLRSFFPCPACGAGAAATRPYPVRHHCLCEACRNDDHTVCLLCGAGR